MGPVGVPRTRGERRARRSVSSVDRSWPEPSSKAQFIRARVFSPLQQVVFGAIIRRIRAPWLLELIKREALFGSSLFARKTRKIFFRTFSTKKRAPEKGLAFD